MTFQEQLRKRAAEIERLAAAWPLLLPSYVTRAMKSEASELRLLADEMDRHAPGTAGGGGGSDTTT